MTVIPNVAVELAGIGVDATTKDALGTPNPSPYVEADTFAECPIAVPSATVTNAECPSAVPEVAVTFAECPSAVALYIDNPPIIALGPIAILLSQFDPILAPVPIAIVSALSSPVDDPDPILMGREFTAPTVTPFPIDNGDALF